MFMKFIIFYSYIWNRYLYIYISDIKFKNIYKNNNIITLNFRYIIAIYYKKLQFFSYF